MQSINMDISIEVYHRTTGFTGKQNLQLCFQMAPSPGSKKTISPKPFSLHAKSKPTDSKQHSRALLHICHSQRYKHHSCTGQKM